MDGGKGKGTKRKRKAQKDQQATQKDQQAKKLKKNQTSTKSKIKKSEMANDTEMVDAKDGSRRRPLIVRVRYEEDDEDDEDRFRIAVHDVHGVRVKWGKGFPDPEDAFILLIDKNNFSTLGDLANQIQKKLGIAPRNQRWLVLFEHHSGVVFHFENIDVETIFGDEALASEFELLIDDGCTAEELSDQYEVWSCVCPNEKRGLKRKPFEDWCSVCGE